MSRIEMLLKEPTKMFLEKLSKITSLKELKIEEINEFAKNLAEKIGKDITTTQLRKVYGEIKRLQRETFDKKELHMLGPRLAYAFAREEQPVDIYAIFEKCYPKIGEKKDLDTFAYILEALVAYHRYEKELKEKIKRRIEKKEEY
ncbi:MAG: type III-A CRISPR-associated protein Csm2 [Nitrososphaerales archaeon]